jgi:hypothetical protein
MVTDPSLGAARPSGIANVGGKNLMFVEVNEDGTPIVDSTIAS